ncbi:helix-turn-helix domain-containing GNAT family N-acetyltransferase [Tabrizicola sp.]|uniref:bifunctional helix-turn-helix transcriptional regulator/GNAT family N-acetyltransferase n=1 Tax=Tabrizicola sp. TaxID=2005166 RepID=UPI00286AFA69|nr:helix-turn-helix domain-containing GNAT family N-acetyltransferase [Tabrizicola sp.]
MDSIDRIRAFNRFYTGHLGLLSRNYLGSGLGLTEVRILHDLDATEPPRARDLALGLGLDEGQVSRVLAGFGRRGWLERRPSEVDARVRDLGLTAAGRQVVAELRAASRAALAEVIPVARAEVVARTLAEAEAALGRGEIALRDLAPGDAGWIIERHGALYAEDEGFDVTFEALVAEILGAFLRQHDPARERGWIAARATLRLGSIFVVAEAPKVAKLRLFLVERSERGTGLAQQMLETALDFARGAGFTSIRLWTHESHRAAGRLYARNGFRLTEAHPVQSFGQDMVTQAWERDL